MCSPVFQHDKYSCALVDIYLVRTSADEFFIYMKCRSNRVNRCFAITLRVHWSQRRHLHLRLSFVRDKCSIKQIEYPSSRKAIVLCADKARRSVWIRDDDKQKTGQNFNFVLTVFVDVKGATFVRTDLHRSNKYHLL